MKRCVVLKNIDQELAADQSVDFDTSTLNLFQGNFPLNDHEGTSLHLCHLGGCLDNFIDRAVGKALILLIAFKRKNLRDQVSASQLFQGFTQFRLEDDHQCRYRNTTCSSQDPEDRVPVKDGCRYRKCHDHGNASQQIPGFGTLDP